MAAPYVQSTHLSSSHTFSKTYHAKIKLIAGIGVEGDCHSGVTVQHTSQYAKEPHAINLRQIHLIQYELFQELASQGYAIEAGQLGENITTWGIDLLSLPRGTYLYFGDGDDVPVVQVTGLRDPGPGIAERYGQALLDKLLIKGKGKKTVRKAGIMGVVAKGGTVKYGDKIRVVMPSGSRQALEPV